MSNPRNNYVVLAMTMKDAATHPAFTGAARVITPRSLKEGLIMTGYVMTDAFYEAAASGRRDVEIALLSATRSAVKVIPSRRPLQVGD